MASVPGIGSGLDINGLVDQLVAAERAPQALRLNRIEAGANARLSALATVSAAFDRLQTALTNLSDTTIFSARAAVSSAPDRFTATATGAVAPGRFDIEVVALASAHKLVSGPLDAEASLGAGTLLINAGASSFSVDIGIDDGSPAGIVAAINAAAGSAGSGLRASLVRSDDGDHIVLNSAETGAAGAITVTRTAGDAALDALVYDPGTLTSLSEQTPAADARIRVDGLLRSSASNVIGDAVDGLSITLVSAAPGEIDTLVISRDDNQAQRRMEAFVSAYNAAVTAIGTSTRFDSATQQAAALNGDSLMRNSALRLRNELGDVLRAASENGLGASRLGLTTSVNGTLKFDAAAFRTTLAEDPEAVTNAIGGPAGLAARLETVVGALIGENGAITRRRDGLTSQVAGVTEQREDLNRRLESVRERFLRQFIALDTLIAQLQSTSSFITQQLSANQSRTGR